MKLGDVLRKERSRRGHGLAEVASALGLEERAYAALEAGDSPAEEWGPHLAALAIALETPASRLLATSGRAGDTRFGQAGPLIVAHRRRLELTTEALAERAHLDVETLREIEAGSSPIEETGPVLLRFAEVIEQPVFNLFYPCGLPFQELDDYP